MHLNFGTFRWLFRQIGLSDGRIIDPAFNGRMAEVQYPQHLPDGQVRLHFFAADFEDQSKAEAFCFGSGKPNDPEPITRELDGATIDTNYLEIVRGDIAGRLTEFLGDAALQDVLRDRANRNTVIIVMEQAFGGLPFQVNDTETLRYIGAHTVET